MCLLLPPADPEFPWEALFSRGGPDPSKGPFSGKRVLVMQFGCPRVQSVMLSFVLSLRASVFLSFKG